MDHWTVLIHHTHDLDGNVTFYCHLRSHMFGRVNAEGVIISSVFIKIVFQVSKSQHTNTPNHILDIKNLTFLYFTGMTIKLSVW